jgi:ribonuclease BN (tRNA processing enzyme)
MKVTMLGTGTAIPVPDRGYAGLLVEVGGERIVCDAGPGTLRQLSRVGVTYLDLDRLFVTHIHPDHSLDLVSILFAMHIPEPGRRTPFTIYGPPGLRRLIDRLSRAYQGWMAPQTYRLTVRELRPGTLRLPGGRVRAVAMQHSTPTLGYRFDAGGASMVYSGDTDAGPGISALARGVDLLILECSMTDERKVAGHLTPSECGRIAAAAGCRHLVLTHFYPIFHGYDIRARVRRNFRGRVTLARDFQSFRLRGN